MQEQIPPAPANQSPAKVRSDFTLRLDSVQSCTETPPTAVGAVLRELDDVIRDLGNAAVDAYFSGDKDGARELLQRQQAARLTRTREHMDRLEREALRRAGQYPLDLDEAERSDGCFFAVMAGAVRRRMGGCG